MAKKKTPTNGNLLETLSHTATVWSGSSWAFIVALATIVVWGATGPLFHFSDTWQLVINTGTTIVTFLMVFLIQRVQNKESLAVQLKLDEIVASLDGASNRLIDIEDMSEEEVENLHKHYKELGRLLKQRGQLTEAVSIDAKGGRPRPKKKP